MKIEPTFKTKLSRLARRTLAIGLVLAPIVLSSSGCRQRAFTELYVEHMASEIRSLEDIVYEFDAEYRALEYEVDDLRRTNAELQSKLQLAQSTRSSLPYDSSPSDTPRPSPSGPSRLNLAPEKSRSGNAESSRSKGFNGTASNGTASNGTASKNAVPNDTVPNDTVPNDVETKDNSSLLKSPPPLKRPRSQAEELGDLNTPEIVIPKQLGPAMKSEAIQLPNAIPPSNGNASAPSSLLKTESTSPSSLLPGVAPPAIAPPSITPPASESVTPSMEMELLPPTLEKAITPASPDKPVRAKEPLHRPAPSGLPDEVSDAVLKDRKIDVPTIPVIQKASANMPAGSGSSGATQALDPRVREIDFHPTLCRGLNLDGKPGDEGLNLVLVPRNASQQFVATNGTLTIVAEETSRDGEPIRVGRWELSEEQLQDLLEPIGAAQGFHIKLPWQDKAPATSTIDVFVRFACTDGTTMVNRKQIHLRTSSTAPSAWTPR